MNKIMVVRHCQSQQNLDHSAGTNTHLTDLGRSQAQAIAKRLAHDLRGQACRLLSSDLHRAWETAMVLAERLGIDPIAAPQLHEWHRTKDDQIIAQQTQRMAEDRRWYLFDWPVGPEAENWRAFYDRVGSFMESVAESASDEELTILVAHGGSVSNIVAWYLEIPADALPDRAPFSGAVGSITMLAKNRLDEPYIERLNDRAHLAEGGLEGLIFWRDN